MMMNVVQENVVTTPRDQWFTARETE